MDPWLVPLKLEQADVRCCQKSVEEDDLTVKTKTGTNDWMIEQWTE